MCMCKWDLIFHKNKICVFTQIETFLCGRDLIMISYKISKSKRKINFLNILKFKWKKLNGKVFVCVLSSLVLPVSCIFWHTLSNWFKFYIEQETWILCTYRFLYMQICLMYIKTHWNVLRSRAYICTLYVTSTTRTNMDAII